jgi:hypothetical protein
VEGVLVQPAVGEARVLLREEAGALVWLLLQKAQVV